MNGAIKITIKYKNPFFINNQVIIKMAVDNRNELDGYLIILCPVDIPDPSLTVAPPALCHRIKIKNEK